jgi:Flp pilus assembly pilin Flp
MRLTMAAQAKIKAKLRQANSLTSSEEETIMDLFIRFTCDEAGASAVEYAFLVTFIAVAIAASVLSLGNAIKGAFETVSTGFPGG